MDETVRRYLAQTPKHTLLPGWAYCSTCDRQLALTKAGLIPIHYRRGESHDKGVPQCPTRSVTP